MAMTKQLWSINALATELGRDRRTIAKALRAVPPDSRSPSGDGRWHLQTVLDALGVDARVGQARTPAQPGFEALEGIKDPLDQVALGALLSVVYQIGPLAASLAIGAGATMRVAYALHNMMIMACVMEAEEFCKISGIVTRATKDGKGIFNLTALAETNWEALAELAGEPVDMRAWEVWARERFNQKAEDYKDP